MLALVSNAQAPTTSFVLISREGRRTLPTSVVGTQEVVALDDLAPLFQLTVKDDPAAGGATVTVRGRSITISDNQSTVSVNGRIVSLPAAVVRQGRRWLVPVEFLQSAVGPVSDTRIQVRRSARMALIGDVRVPRVTARIGNPGPPTQLTLEVNPPTAITASQDGNRVVVKVDADALDLALPAAGAGLVQQVRAGEQANTIVITLDAAAGDARFSTSGDVPDRLVVDVPGTATAAQDAPDPPAAARAPGQQASPIDPSAILSRRGVLQTVVIDPGHGGTDAGVHGRAGSLEKDLTLDVAKRLRTLLEARLGGRIVLTRDDDTALDLDARAALANNRKGELFISLHANAAPSSYVAGAEVYYLQPGREGERARQESERAAVSLPTVAGGPRSIEFIQWDLAQVGHVDASAMFAALVAEEMINRKTFGGVSVHQAPLRVLEGVNMPAVLVEMAYLTNEGQEKLAGSDEFKNELVEAIGDAVARFKRQPEDGPAR